LKRHQLFYCVPKENIVEPIKKDDSNVLKLLTQIKEHQLKMEEQNIKMKEDHKQEIAELKNTILELKEQKPSSVINNNNNSNNNNSNNTTNNTVILNFGSDNASKKLSKKEIQYIVNASKEYLFQRSIEVTHFNNKHPDLQNVYIPDKKMQMANIYKDDKFILKEVDSVIHDLITDHQNNLDDYRKMDDIIISDKKREEMEEYVDNFHTFNESGSNKQKQVYDDVTDNIKLILYNNKDKVKDTEKRVKRKKQIN